jgi:two-component system, NtrC family, response regulator AtoC
MEVVEAGDEQQAREVIHQAPPTAVLTDLALPGGDGLGVLSAAKASDGTLPVIVATEPGNVLDAVSAMKGGALDCVVKPLDLEQLVSLVERAVSAYRELAEVLPFTTAAGAEVPGIVGRDPRLATVLRGLGRAAATDATVLLQGESGTGKELFARALHLLSPRADGPFVAINCAAIPENLLESELFGHEKGAFTGAVARKLGKFEVADGGTLFLDEIGDLPGALQAKILRAVELRSFERVGGTKSITVDVRQVAATNRELRTRVAAGLFREDLFFRLSVFPIQIPPLRDRMTDVPLLARFFLVKICADLGRPLVRLSLAAEDHLMSYAWPGNVRELQNCIERAVIMCEGTELLPADLSLDTGAAERPVADPWDAIDLSGSLADASSRTLGEVERRKIVAALKDAGSHTGRAADALQISHRALIVKMQEHGIET